MQKPLGIPQLLGVALLYLRPLLHKLYVALNQIEAALRVLVNDIILVLKEQRVKQHIL